jgi:hypothetical protein
VIELGFADVQAYLVDRVVEQAWLLADMAAELAAHRLTVRRLLYRSSQPRVACVSRASSPTRGCG